MNRHICPPYLRLCVRIRRIRRVGVREVAMSSHDRRCGERHDDGRAPGKRRGRRRARRHRGSRVCDSKLRRHFFSPLSGVPSRTCTFALNYKRSRYYQRANNMVTSTLAANARGKTRDTSFQTPSTECLPPCGKLQSFRREAAGRNASPVEI